MRKITTILLILSFFSGTVGCSLLGETKGNYKVSGEVVHEVANLLGDGNGKVKITLDYVNKVDNKLVVHVTYENLTENAVEFGWLAHPSFELYDSNGNKAKTSGLLTGYDSKHKEIKRLEVGEKLTTQVEFYEVTTSETYQLLVGYKDDISGKLITSSFEVEAK